MVSCSPENQVLKFDSGNTSELNYCVVLPPIKEYINQITNQGIKILVIGTENTFTADYLFRKGFTNTHYLNNDSSSIKDFIKRLPHFPSEQLFCENFFLHSGKYDLILEQTFFSSLPRSQRYNYVKKVHELLSEKGKLVGVLFNPEFNTQDALSDAIRNEYCLLFKNCFNFMCFEEVYNSLKSEAVSEIFIILIKKDCVCRQRLSSKK